MPCDEACRKIIIDTKRLARVATGLAETAASHLAAFELALKEGKEFTPDELDQLHAESELDCHRAAAMVAWSEERHAATVRMNGGEYHGGYAVDGVNGVTKKE